METNFLKYSSYLLEKYKEKVYKLPINLDVTCPNRINGGKGCIFCSEAGAGFEVLPKSLSVSEQLKINREYISQKYKAKKFIAYLQNFTNTFMPLEKFKHFINEIVLYNDIHNNIVEIAISTRPDCINHEYLKFLQSVYVNNNINISIELGLQTVNYHSLIKCGRGHTLAEFIDAVLNIHKFDFEICAHIILNLPWDNMCDVIESAKILSALKIKQVKLHSLYILKDTRLGEMFENKEFSLISKEDYIKRVITFLEYLNPNIAVQRLTARVPKQNLLFVNWDMSWWKIHDEIVQLMFHNNIHQGDKFDYLNGSKLKSM